MTATYIALANYTLPSNAATVTFANIPNTYRDLVLLSQAGQTVTGSIWARANGDSANNYSEVFAWGDGSTTSTGSSTVSGFPISFADSSLRAMVAHFMDYSATDKHKTALVRHGAGVYVMMSTSRWANTAAITSLTIAAGAGNLVSGSTFALYGIAS